MDATKRPLRVPPSFSVYAEEHGLFELFKKLMCEIIVDKPDDPLSYAIEWLERDGDQAPKFAILGAPGSGKTSVSRYISEQVRVVLVDEKELLSDHFNTSVLKVLEIRNQDGHVSNDLWVQLICDRVGKPDCLRRGYILEGFPQNREQAIDLQARGILLDHVAILEAPSVVLMERRPGKRVDPTNGNVYHTAFDWPDDQNVQDRLIEDDHLSDPDMFLHSIKEYQCNIDGVKQAYENFYKVVNADQPKSDVISQVQSFLNEQDRVTGPHTPKILLIGPVGSGKSTLAKKLAAKYDLVNIDCGQVIKEHIAGQTKLGLQAKQNADRGLLVDNNVVMKMLAPRLGEIDPQIKGWVLHGYPVTKIQAENLIEAGFAPNRVYFLDMPADSIIERLSYRMLDPITGERYHELYDPPSDYDVRMRCVKHPRDNENNIKKKLDNYYYFHTELADIFQDFKPFHVNADQDHHTIMEFVESTIVKLLPRDLQNDTSLVISHHAV